jgi:hypothetical protein
MIRPMSHDWRPLDEQSRGNRDGITILLMSRHWPSASDVLVAGGRRVWRSRERGLVLSRQPFAVRNRDVIMVPS